MRSPRERLSFIWQPDAKCSSRYIPGDWLSRELEAAKTLEMLDILSPRPRFLSSFGNNSAAPTSPQQVDAVAIHGLILESVRKR